MKQPRYIISGGGTGGHIYPAIAIANELKKQNPDCEILFIGAQDKMEMQKVPAAGYPIEGLWISGIQRSLSLKNLQFPFKLMSSLWKSMRIIKKFRPDVVIGTGGFASGSVVKVAASMGIPTVIQEQNSYPGITNKALAGQAKAICVAYDEMERFFPKHKLHKTGNPIREDLLNVSELRNEAQSFYQLDPSKKTIVVLGGSLGARKINQLIESKLQFFKQNGFQVLWQCGKLYHQEYGKYNQEEGIQVFDFIERMDLLYAAADVIVSRAGASSVSELAIVGKPVLFIPSPNVAEDHQTKNAMSVVKHGGAEMLKESEVDAKFETVILQLVQEKRAREISQNLKKLSLPNATKDIVEIVKNLIP